MIYNHLLRKVRLAGQPCLFEVSREGMINSKCDTAELFYLLSTNTFHVLLELKELNTSILCFL